MTDQPRDRPAARTSVRVDRWTSSFVDRARARDDRARHRRGAKTTRPNSTTEQRRILQLCADPTSIAEVSAHLSLPLGVARVLVGDMVTEGFLDSHANPASAEEGSRPDLRLLERVLDGLQAL